MFEWPVFQVEIKKKQMIQNMQGLTTLVFYSSVGVYMYLHKSAVCSNNMALKSKLSTDIILWNNTMQTSSFFYNLTYRLELEGVSLLTLTNNVRDQR